MCGAPLQGNGGPVHAPSPGPAAGGGSAAKLIAIVLGGVLLLGAIGVGGLVYLGYRAKQRIARFKQEYSLGGGSTAGSGSSAQVASFPASKGSGCPMMEGQEAARILGVAVERVEHAPKAADGSEGCSYWVGPAERRRLINAEIASGVGAVGKGEEKDSREGVEKLVGGALGAMIETAGDNTNSDPAFSLQLWRSNGQAMWGKSETAKADVRGATGIDLGALGVQPMEGVGDKATVLPGGHSILVLKGDAFFVLGFQQFVPGRDKTAALAKLVAGRL